MKKAKQENPWGKHLTKKQMKEAQHKANLISTLNYHHAFEKNLKATLELFQSRYNLGE